jgi:hypothetical protein
MQNESDDLCIWAGKSVAFYYSQLSHNPYLSVDGPGYGLSKSMALERYAKNRIKKLGKFENDTSQIHGEIHHEKYRRLLWVIPTEKISVQLAFKGSAS